MQGPLDHLTKDALYQNLDHHELVELARYFYMVSYVVKEIIEEGEQSTRTISLLWMFVMDYNVISLEERLELYNRSMVYGDWHATVINMATNHFLDTKEKYMQHPSSALYGSPIRYISGSYSDDPAVMYLSVNTHVKNISSNYYKNMDCLTTIIFTGQISSIKSRAVVDCPNLQAVYVPAGVSIGDNAFPKSATIYRYSDKIEAPVTPTQDIDDLINQIADLKKKCEEYEESGKYLEENESLKAELEALKQQLADKETESNSRIQELEAKLAEKDNLLVDFDNTSQKLTESTDEVVKLKEEITASQNEIAKLQEQLTTSNSKVSALTTSLSEMSTKVTDKSGEQKLQEELNTALAEKEQLNSELALASNSLNTLNEEKNELQTKLQEASESINSLTTDNERLQSLNDDLTKKLSEQEVGEKTEALNEKLSAAIEEKEKAWAMASELTRKIDSLDEDVKKLEEHHEEEKAVFAKAVTAAPNYTRPSEVRDAGKQILVNVGVPATDDFIACAYAVMLQQKFNDILIDYKDKNDGLLAQINEVKQEVSQRDNLISEKEKELDEAKNTISELNESAKQNEEYLEAIQKIEELKAKYSDEESKRIALEEQLTAEQDKVSSLTEQLESSKTTSDTEVTNLQEHIGELEEKVKELASDNELKDARLAAFTVVPDREAELNTAIGSVEFLGITDKDALIQKTDSVVEDRSLMLPDGWENNPLAQASIILMNEEFKILESKIAETPTEEKPSINIDNYPMLKTFLTSEAVEGLLQASGIDVTDDGVVASKLEAETQAAKNLIGNGQMELKYGTMWPSTYKELLDKTQPREADIANGITQLDYVRAIEVLKTLLEEKKLSSQSIRQIQDLVMETRKVNKYKDAILSVMSKYGETDYDAVYQYVLDNGDQSYRHILRSDPDQFVAEEVDEVLKAKHTVQPEKVEPEHKGVNHVTEADIYAEISRVYNNDGNEFLMTKYNELSGRVPSEVPEGMRLTMIMEMLKTPPVDNPAQKKPTTNRNAYKSSAKSILSIYNTSDTLEVLEEELKAKYGSDIMDPINKTENILWILDAYLFVRQGFRLDDATNTAFDAYTCKRRLLSQLPDASFEDIQRTFDSLVAKNAKLATDEVSIYRMVYNDITTLKEPVIA